MTFGKTRKIVLCLTLCFGLSACQEDGFYEKDFLEGANVDPDHYGEGNPNDPIGNDDEDGQTQGPLGDNTSPTGDDSPGNDQDPVGDNGTPGDDQDPTGDGTDPDSGSDPTCGNNGLVDASDSFTQNAQAVGKMDILWVIDNSGSMGNEQDALAFNFSAFIDSFLAKDADFQMAITTTDFQTVNSSLTALTSVAANADENQFKDDFRNMIRVGTDGSGQEKGLRGAEEFLDDHSSYLRDDAYLAVVVVSDEEDQSEQAVDDYISYYQNLKSNPGLVKVYSIVTTELTGNQWETVGDRYIDASGKSGGFHESIHDDFHTSLTNIGGSLVNLLSSFPLSGVPAGATITVVVDGVEMTQGWTYDAQGRVIFFNQGFVPDAGAVIEVFYKVAC